MRYIVLPAFGLLYLWWSYSSIKELIRNEPIESGFTISWTILHFVGICLGFIWLCDNYW